MKPVRTPATNVLLTLPGGTKDNDLPATRALLYDAGRGQTPSDAELGYVTTWMPDDAEARRLEQGAAVELTVWGKGHPPVAVGVTEGVVAERELIDRAHVDRAVGALYVQLKQRAEVLGLPPSGEFVDLWIAAVDATRPPEAGGPGVTRIPDDASPLEDPNPVPPPPHADCRAPDRVCWHPTSCPGDPQGCRYETDRQANPPRPGTV